MLFRRFLPIVLFWGRFIVITSNSFSFECTKVFEVKFRRICLWTFVRNALFIYVTTIIYKMVNHMKSKLIYSRNKIVCSWVLICILNWFTKRSGHSHMNERIKSILTLKQFIVPVQRQIDGKKRKKLMQKITVNSNLKTLNGCASKENQ